MTHLKFEIGTEIRMAIMLAEIDRSKVQVFHRDRRKQTWIKSDLGCILLPARGDGLMALMGRRQGED